MILNVVSEQVQIAVHGSSDAGKKNDLHILAHVGSAHILGVFCLEVQEGASVDHVDPKRLY